MATELLPTTRVVRDVFEEEIAAAGGRVTDCFDDEDALYMRATLRATCKPRPNDKVQAGVGLIAVGEEIRVHPYTFRQVCRNGAIMPHTLATECVHCKPADTLEWVVAEVESELRRAVRACTRPEVFSAVADRLRAAANWPADTVLGLLPMVRRAFGSRLLAQFTEIMRRHALGGDDSAYGLMNAVTSVARDQTNPHDRWRLEEFGGRIPALVPPAPKPDARAAELLAV